MRWCPDGDLLAFFCVLYFRVQHISDMHSKIALRPHNVWKYFRHSEIRREKRKKEETTGRKYNVTPYVMQGGHN